MYSVEELDYIVNQGLDALENNNADERTRARLREAKYEVNCKLESYKDEIEFISQKISEQQNEIKDEKISPKNKKDLEKSLKESKEQIAGYGEKIKKLEEIKKELDECFSEKQAFDKAKFIRNIRELVRVKDVKIGQIESTAGVRTGYLSRLDKKGNDTLPSIAFLISAAKLLDVTIDDLINREMGSMSEDEKYVDDFLKDLITDTENHLIHWKKESDDIRGEYNLFNNPPDHPLLFADDSDIKTGNIPPRVSYGSLFYIDSKVYAESAYSTEIAKNNSVYVVQCFTDKKDKIIPQKRFIEIYVTDKEGHAKPVCNTIQNASRIIDTVYKLF